MKEIEITTKEIEMTTHVIQVTDEEYEAISQGKLDVYNKNSKFDSAKEIIAMFNGSYSRESEIYEDYEIVDAYDGNVLDPYSC